jgi:hypothetical protein
LDLARARLASVPLGCPLIPEASAALISRESLSTAGIEDEQLDPADVSSSVARRLQLPLESRQPRTNIKVDGLVNLLLNATASWKHR